MTVVPDHAGTDFVGHDVILVAADTDTTLATVYRMALVIALEEFFGCVQIFSTELALAKYCQPTWPGERVDQGVTELVHGTASARPDARQDQRSV
jgi:hypothetical protein